MLPVPKYTQQRTSQHTSNLLKIEPSVFVRSPLVLFPHFIPVYQWCPLGCYVQLCTQINQYIYRVIKDTAKRPFSMFSREVTVIIHSTTLAL